jgi:hypothetical protein
MPTVISVSIRLPVSSVPSACYCLDRDCVVLKSLVTSGYDRTIRRLLQTYAYTYLSAARNIIYYLDRIDRQVHPSHILINARTLPSRVVGYLFLLLGNLSLPSAFDHDRLSYVRFNSEPPPSPFTSSRLVPYPLCSHLCPRRSTTLLSSVLWVENGPRKIITEQRKRIAGYRGRIKKVWIQQTKDVRT